MAQSPLKTLATSLSGDIFGINFILGYLAVPTGYTSGSSLSASTTYASQTFASLGMTAGSYVWSWGSGGSADSFILNVGAIPEPSTALLVGIGLAGLGVRRRQRRAA